MRFVSSCLGAAALVAVASSARAADGASPVVVDVSPAASDLAADELRRQIGAELDAPVLAPGDAGAESARGTLTVDVDRATNQLLVSYASRVVPIVRRARLPQDPGAARREATILAGKLARDENLASREPASVPKPSYAADAERMNATIAYHAARERVVERAFGWTTLGLGAATLVWGVVLAATRNGASTSVLSLGAGLTGSGAYVLLVDPATPFQQLEARETYDSSSVAEAWATMARDERSMRKNTAILAFGASALAIGFGTVVVADPHIFGSSVSTGERQTTGALCIGVGAVFAAAAIYALAVEGPIEESLDAYELGTGRVIHDKEEAGLRLRFGLGAVQGTF